MLPFRQAAWTVVVQRLGETADACARLGREVEAGGGRVGGLEPTLRAIAARLQARLDERP